MNFGSVVYCHRHLCYEHRHCGANEYFLGPSYGLYNLYFRASMPVSLWTGPATPTQLILSLLSCRYSVPLSLYLITQSTVTSLEAPIYPFVSYGSSLF